MPPRGQLSPRYPGRGLPSRAASRARSNPRARRGTSRARSRTGRRLDATGGYTRTASRRLTRFRQASRLAVALTGFLLFLWTTVDLDEAGAQPAPAPADAVEEATSTIQDLVQGFYALLPKLAIALGILLLAYVLSRILRALFTRLLASWSRGNAVSALTSVILFLVALGTALSVIAGDARALVGSVGLAGLALSWALQTPIESFTGWLLNSFRSHYRVGDRIAVGDVFGDVHQVDVMSTTVWELGGPDKDVHGAQPTGALITFPNSEILRASIVNYTREFPYVWDEVMVGVSGESDLAYAMTVVREAAARVIGPNMKEPARRYARLLAQQRLDFRPSDAPSVYVSPSESWTNLVVRYLIPVRERRQWSTELLVRIGEELARPEHRGRIVSASPRLRVELLRDGPGPRVAEERDR